MEKEDAIRKFAIKRPASVGVYGYGSGVFKQSNTSGSKPLTDVIFIVPDLKEWHRENMETNGDDYSFTGRIHLSRKNVSKLKGKNNITYFSEIKDGDYTFKYGVIEVQDFKRSLETWDNLFVAGRFHKPVLEVSSSDEIRRAIDFNRKSALMIASLFCGEICSRQELFNVLCSLSYIGDARMKIAENPHKVENIVDGSFSKLTEIYPIDSDYMEELESGFIHINHARIVERFYELPDSLLQYLYLSGTDFNDVTSMRENIVEFLLKKNSCESKAQIIEGVKTNGIVRSVPYALAKVKKRFGK